MAMLEMTVHSTYIEFNWDAIKTQAVIGAGCALIAWSSFLRIGVPKKSDILNRSPLLNTLVSTIAFISVLAIGMTVVMQGAPLRASTLALPDFSQSPPAKAETRFYHFSYPAHMGRRVAPLIETADEVFLRVHELLEEPPGEPILADLSGSTPNYAGVAHGGRIRMLPGHYSEALLAHETAHVVSERMTGESSAIPWNNSTVLNEGISTWVERHFTNTADNDPHMFVLAALYQRHSLDLESMADFLSFRQERDENLKYPAGYVIIQSAIDLYGPSAPGKIVRAFSMDSFPKYAQGLTLWSAVFQLADMDLGSVLTRAYSVLSQEANRIAPELSTFPRPIPTLVTDGDQYGVVVHLDEDIPSGWRLRFRFKPAMHSAHRFYSSAIGRAGEVVWRHPQKIRGNRVCVQTGLGNNDVILYEPWICIPTQDAVFIDPENIGLN